MSDQSLSMWSYWRNKRSNAAEAVKLEYPALLANDATLQYFVNQYEMSLAAIETRMQLLTFGAGDES